MRKSLFTIAITFLLSFVSVSAETLKPTSWSSYGVSFLAPADIIVDDDSEESYTISNSGITINIQLLNGDGLKKGELISSLKHISEEDNVTDKSDITEIDLTHFFGAYLTGNCETAQCLYSYLTVKDNSCSFYISIIYKPSTADDVIKIIRSFKLDE